MKRFVIIQFADGLVKTFDIASLNINDMKNIYSNGGVVIGYETQSI